MSKAKIRLVRNIIRAVLCAVVLVSLYLVLSGIISSSIITLTVTLNWRMCYLGLVLLFVAIRLNSWLFPKKTRKDNYNAKHEG